MDMRRRRRSKKRSSDEIGKNEEETGRVLIYKVYKYLKCLDEDGPSESSPLCFLSNGKRNIFKIVAQMVELSEQTIRKYVKLQLELEGKDVSLTQMADADKGPGSPELSGRSIGTHAIKTVTESSLPSPASSSSSDKNGGEDILGL